MQPQPGITVREWMDNARHAVSGQLVMHLGIKYFAGNVDLKRWEVELYIDTKHDQPYAHGSLDSVEFI